MELEGQVVPKISVSAKVIRADGTKEEVTDITVESVEVVENDSSAD